MAFEKKILRRIRRRPNKKWLPHEDAAIVAFLKSERNFEKPTAREYYTKLLNRTLINSDWKSCRAKVRNMRMSYSKAKAWQNSADASTLKGNKIIRDATLKIFAYFDDFENIFNSRDDAEEIKTENTDTDCEQMDDPCDDIDSTANSLSDMLYESSRTSDGGQSATTSKRGGICAIQQHSDGVQLQTETPSMQQKQLAEIVYCRPEMDNIIKLTAETMGIKKQTFDQNLFLKEKEIALRQEQFHFEKEKIQKELEHKDKELKSQEKLKVLELEMKERIAMEELHLRERIAIKELLLKERLAMKENKIQ